MKIAASLLSAAQEARRGARALSTLPDARKNACLEQMAESLRRNEREIIEANARDLTLARSGRYPKAFIERLSLDGGRIAAMADSLRCLAQLPDPVGDVIKSWRRPNGLWIHKVRVPIGVIAVIYESRPNVTADCIGLCFKSGNSVILKGGSESLYSNQAIHAAIEPVLRDNNLPAGCAHLIRTRSRTAVRQLLGLSGLIDLVMPRGGEGLIEYVVKHSTIPVIKHYKGVCHVYVDEHADLNMAHAICLNAKLQRPGVCNAMECMLVHRDVAARFLPVIGKAFTEAGVRMRGCPLTRKLIKTAQPVRESDYYREYLGLTLNIRVVSDLRQAVEHISTYGSSHSDAIVTEHYDNAMEFVRSVDSACVYVNASTRFTDGYQFGFGAEIGISTDKLHARGPVGLEELTTYKYAVFGSGQVRTA